MTPKHVIKVQVSEIQRIEITCNECGTMLVIPTTREIGPIQPVYSCHCGIPFWSGQNDGVYDAVSALIGGLRKLSGLKKPPTFALSFTLDSN